MGRLHEWVYAVAFCLLGAALGVAIGFIAVTLLKG